MASGGAEEDNGGIPLDIDNVHMLLQVEHEQIQKRTFTNWVNAQLAKRSPPLFVSDLFSDLKDGSRLLDLLEVTSGQSMKRQRGHGIFQQRANIETAINFLKKKSIKLVNINIPDIIDGRPSIILGLVWTIILRCHIEELASTLSFSSRHSSLDSLTSLDSWCGSPVPASPVPAGRTSPLHRRFRVSAKKALLMWVRDQCQSVGSSIRVKDFKSSWRSGEAFLAILCSLRPQLVDLSLVRTRSNKENLEKAFHLAERELHIPRLLEPQDVDVEDPDEKSIMTYVAQFLQYSNDMPAPDDHLQLFPQDQPSCFSPVNLPTHFFPAISVSPLHQVSPCEQAHEVTCWLQQAFKELTESWTATGNSSYTEKYQVLQRLTGSFAEQKRPVMTLLTTMRRSPELSGEQQALRAAWDQLEEELQRCNADLDLSLPPPLDSVVVWLLRAEAALTDEGGNVKDHADAAKRTRAQQDALKTLINEMSHHVQNLDDYHNMDASGSVIVPDEKFDEIKRRVTHVRVTAKYQGIKLEYQEYLHTVLDLLNRINAKIQTWKTPYKSNEAVLVLLQDWHETVERQGVLLILMDSLQNLKEKMNVYTSKAALGEKSQFVINEVKEAEIKAEFVKQAVMTVRGMMERAASAWEIYNKCLSSLQTWLLQTTQAQTQSPAAGTQQDISEWTSCQAKLNEAGNWLIEVTEPATSQILAKQLSKVNMQWAECVKRSKFEVTSEPSGGPLCLQMVQSLTHEATLLLRQPLIMASVPLKKNIQKLQLLSKKMAEVDMSSQTDIQTTHTENLQQTLPQMLAEAERTCWELQRAASRLEGRLAELDHWSTDALDCYQHLKEQVHKGRSALTSTAKALMSRGLQLEKQVLTEGRDLLEFVAQVQKTSPLQHISTSAMQDRISEAISHCQENLGMFSSLGFQGHVSDSAHQTQRQPEAGLFVVARTKHLDHTANVKLQSHDPSHLESWPKIQEIKPQHETTIVIPCVEFHLAQPLAEPVPQFHSEDESKPLLFSESHQASSLGQNYQVLPSLTQSAATEGKENSSPSQTHKSKLRIRGQANTQQMNKPPPQPPVMVRGEVHSKAQSMARSRLEKARVHLQGRIQQAIKLFGGKEISESQLKKKERALKILQPVILEDFLGAVEGFGAFCSGNQLQDLMLLSDSVRKQWEDVCREMAAFVPNLRSKIREGTQSFSVVQSETHTNALHEAADHTDHDSLQQQQAIVDKPASVEEGAELLKELWETVTPSKSPCLATEQLKELDETQGTSDSDTVFPTHSRRQQLGGHTLLGVTSTTANAQPSDNLPQKQSGDCSQQDLSPVAGSVPLHGDTLPLRSQDAPTGKERKDQLTQHKGFNSGQNLKPALRAQEQKLKARLLHTAGNNQQAQTHIQAVVCGNTVETKQEAEWTVITEAVGPQQEEHSSEQEILERYRKSCLVFQSQLHENKQHLEEFVPEPAPISTLQKQNKQLQILKQKTEALWFEFELHHAHLSRTPHLLTRDDLNEVERSRKQLTLEWRGQQICLKNRMISLDLMESADAHMAAITQKLDGIIREPVDISSYNLADPHQQSDLKEMDNRLQSEMRKLSKQISEEERQQPKATSLHQALHNSVSHLKQLRQRLEKVQLAAQAVDRFLATVRDVKAEIPAPQANQDASRQRNEANWEQERRCWQTAMELRLRTAAEQADSVDNDLKAAGMTLTMDGAAVTCQEVVTSLYKHVVDVEKTLMRERESKDEISPVGKKQMQRNEELNPVDLHLQTKPGNDSLQQGAAQEQEHLLPSGMEERQKQNTNTKPQREEDHKAQICRSEVDVNDQRGRSSQVEKEREGKTSLVQRRAAFLGTVREIRAAAEHLGLREPTLPALQHRTRALIEMESRLAGLLSELRYIQEASSSGVYGVSQTSEVEEVWEETTKAVAERLENCRVLTELLKTFQSSRGELSATLQRAENTISEQTSYMGKDNLQRLYTKVQEAKAELNGLGDVIEEVRSVCRQLHSHLRHIPECTIIPFENEADALMDSWLDISERTESHLENLHLGLTLWDGVLQLGTEVESWAADKLAEFTQSPSFQSEDEMKTLQNEVVAQEKSVERFQQRVTEIQSLLQSADPPLELQLAETQMKKKIEQVKELGSEAEDVYRQMVAAKEQITARMAECFSALQKIEDSLVTLGGSDVAAVLAKLKGLCRQLQTQDEQAESLLEDLRVMTTIASPGSLQSLSEGEIRLQEKIRNSHKLFSEVEEQTQRNIQDLDRLQKESEHLEQWLKASEDKATKVEDVSVLQEEALEQRVRTELLCQLVLSLQSSNLQQSPLVEESSKLLEQYHNFHVDVQRRSRERQCTLSRDAEAFRALSKSTQSWVGDLRQLVESVLCENPVEQRLHRVQDELSAMADGEARLEELRAAGTGLSVRLCDGDDLKQEIQETIQKIEEQWKDVVQSVEPYYRILHTDPELTSSFLARRQEVGCRVKELQHQFGQLPTLFPWPGTSERRRTCLLARQLWGKYESLQLTLTGLAEQRRELAEQTNNAIWNESSWTELDNYCLSLMAELKDVCSRLEEGASNEEHFCQLLQDCHHKLTSLQERMSACQAEKENSTGLFTDVAALESLLQETTDVEKDILQLYTLKDSITDSSTVEARASISQQVSSLQNHKRALDSNIRKSFLQIIQQVKGEFACVQKELDENVGNQCESQDVSPDINQLKQQWCAAQDCDTRLTELSARVHTLQKVGESSNGQNRLPADVILAVDEVAKDIDSSRTSFLQRKQEFAVNTANQVREVIMLLQQWSQRVQADPLSPSQATLDEGLCLQQSVRELLPEKGFLPNCLGKKALKKLKKKASDALNESTTALETLSKCLMSQGYGEVESDDKDSMHKTGAETSLLPRELMATPPPESPSSSTDGKETGGSDQNDTSIITKDPLFTELPTSTLGGSKAEADAKKMDETPISAEKVNISAIHSAESFVKTANIDALVPDQDTTAKIHDQPKISMKTNFKPKDDSGNICTDSSPQTNGHRELSGNNTVSITVSDSPHNLSKSLIAQPEKPELLQEDTTSILESERSDVTSFGSKPESESENLAQSEIFKGFSSTDAQEQERSSEDVNVPPKKVFTIVLDIDLPVYQLQGMQQRENDGGSSPHVLRCSQGADRSGAKLTGVSNTGLPGPTFPPVKQEEVTDSCHTEKKTMSSPLCTVESSVQTGRALTKSHIPANTAEHVQMAEGDNTEDPNDPEKPESKHFEVSEGRDDTSLLKEENESKIPAAMEETKVTKGQPQRQEDMKPDRTAPGPSADLGAEETTGESPESCKHASTMQDILSEIQSLVERSNIINRSPHVDLNWYLKSSPGESDIRLFRTVQQVLACRYQPAKLDVTAMAKQLVEAEECRCCVQEQVATMKSSSAARDPNALKRAKTQWSTALLDASATVQVKATQLDQVKQYHKQMKMTRAFLEVLAAEKEKMSLNALGSSAVQADKLHILLQTMEQKKTIMQELLHLSSQLSVHLSDAESSGALLAQLGDVQEEWRLLEGSIKRALHQATNTTSQSSHLLKEAEQLEAKLEALRQSNLQSNDSKSALELVCLTTDLKLYTQLYLHLQSQSEALVHFSLGQKEKDEIQHKLQGLGSLLNDTKRKLHPSAYSSGGISSIKINKQLQDLIIWAKQAENHISIGKKLVLFPEVARTQIVDMKKFQTDILSQRSKIQTQVEEMKDFASDTEKDESDQVLKTIEDLYEAIADSLDHVLDTMKKHLQEREKLLSQLANVDAWLAETHATRDPCAHVENVFKADIQKLESELENHKLTIVEIQSQLKLVEEMAESFKDLAVELSSGESRYLVNRLSGLWTELDGLLAHERATSWELEELIHERTTSDIELSNIQASLKQISVDLAKHKFPFTQETLSAVANLKHVLLENQCEVQELQHCHKVKRSAMLCAIGELQDRCKALSLNAFEQEKYLHLRRQMEESRDIAKEQIQRVKDTKISLEERIRLCQTLLVELPLVKTQCQEAGDQLEAIAQELYPSDVNSERQNIHGTLETLLAWEHSVTDDIKNLEAELLKDLQFLSELPVITQLFRRTKAELEGAKPINPDEKAIDSALRRFWVMWRNMESGMRVLEALGQGEKNYLNNHKELYSLRDAAMKECHLQMEDLSHARESLKDYQWAAQGAISFLHNAEATFLSAPGGFLDCTEEHRQTQQALEQLEDGFQAHISHLVGLVPQQPCLSRIKVEELHISILSQLLAGRALLEAQAQLRLDSLQSCVIRQQSHMSCHEDIWKHLSGLEAELSEYAATQVTSYEQCVAQQKRAMLLKKDLHNLAGKIEELKAGCPMQGCGVGKDGEQGALWRRWVALRRSVGLLMAHAEQRQEEWKDITTSMEKSCSFLAGLQAEVLDSSNASFSQEKSQEFLAQAEMHQARLELEQQTLASLERRLEHALSISLFQGPISPGPFGKTLVKLQEEVRSLKERNLQVVAVARREEKERHQMQEEMGEVEKHMSTILPTMEACSNPSKRQELTKDLSTQKLKLKHIMDGIQRQYAVIPADVSKHLQKVQLTVQRAEEELMEENSSVQKLAGQVTELGSGLEKVKALLEQRSPNVNEAQKVIKRVWDELDSWHSHLMLLENEVQDLAEEQPDQAHLLMDKLTQPLQLHQDASQMAEYRTSFLSKIPTCLKEFEDIMYSATCWLDEAQSWLSAPCSFTTGRSLQNHANSLQLVLEDSERIRNTLHDFRPALAEISAVCDISMQEERLEHSDQQVHKMQRSILEPLDQLLQTVVVVETLEAELKTIEKNVPKIRTILSSMDNSSITLTEHLHNHQVILANVQSMRRTLEEIEKFKDELHLPPGAAESLLVFPQARLLLQPLEELEHLTQQQTSLLESKMEERTSKDLVPGETQQPNRSPQRHLIQEMSNSEEEDDDDDDDKSSHSSSSSDTLTCSIPEDPEETLIDLEPLTKVEKLKNLTHSFSSDMETSSEDVKFGLLSVKPQCDTIGSGCKTGLLTMDSKAEVADSSRPKTLTAEPLITTTIPAAEDQSLTAATLNQHESPKHKTFNSDLQTKSPQAVEGTRLIPSRPIAPFTASREFIDLLEEGDEDLSLSGAPRPDLVQDTHSGSKEQSKVQTSQTSLTEESQQVQEPPQVQDSSAEHDENKKEQQRWSQLYTQISQKLASLKKVQEEYQTLVRSDDGRSDETVSEKELVPCGSASPVLQQTQDSISMLRHLVKSEDSSHPYVKEELYEAARRVLLCLNTLTDLLLTPGIASERDSQLKLLQLECLSTDLVTIAELLNKVESETKSTLMKEEPQAQLCLTCLQDCLCTVQLVYTSSSFKNQHQYFISQLCILDEFQLGRSEIFPSLKDPPSLEQCVLGRHLRESPGKKAKLQQASRCLLQGITHLLELGEECIRERQMSQVHNRSQLQVILCRPKKLLQILTSQLAFVHHLFQREPEILRCQEDERLQLEVKAKAFQQQALEQEVVFQRRLQAWTLWEDKCSQLSKLLDEFEALISSGEPEGEEEEFVIQHRLNTCQQTLLQLEENKVALGLLLDQCKVLQAEPVIAASVRQAGGALELRWRSVFRRTEQEIQRCADFQDIRARFQADFASISNWLITANKHLKTWSDMANTSDLNQKQVHKNLIELLDFSMEVEANSVQKASVSRKATRLLHLKEADCPMLRAQISELEVKWSQLTSDLSKIQEQLHQRLLAEWPPVELMSDLEDWLRKLEVRLNQDKETVLSAKDSAQITKVLQHYEESKAAIVRGQHLLDFLCQSGPIAVGTDVQTLWSEQTTIAEKLGTLKVQWLNLQRELENQIHGAEQMHHTCADREKQLQHLRHWIEQQKKQLNQWKQPISQTLSHNTLLEWEGIEDKAKEVMAALQELKATLAYAEKEEEHLCDIAFSNQIESVCHTCENLSQQIKSLRPALQQTVEDWSRFDRDLREVTLLTSRVRCALQHQQVPLFSLKQAEGYRDFLLQLQGKTRNGEELWTAVEKSFQSVIKTFHGGAAQELSDHMEGEQKQWKDVVQELKDEEMKIRQILSLWREYSPLSENCSLRLQNLWLQWEELTSSSRSPDQDTQVMVQSVEKLQEVAHDLQSSVGDVLEASKPLIGRLQPLAASLIQSETRLLSRDVVLLSQAMSGKKLSLQEDLKEQKMFHTCLQTLEKQTQNIHCKLKAGLKDKDSVKQVLMELTSLFPSLVDVREMNHYLSLTNQERDSLHMLSRKWTESMTRISDMNRALQTERSFQERCKILTHIKEKLTEEPVFKKPQSDSCLEEILTVHQRLQFEIITGHQLLQDLFCDAVKTMEKETGQKRSELIAQVTCLRESWFSAVALVGQHRSLAKDEFRQRRIYQHGLKLLWKLLRDVDPLLPPAGPALCTLQRVQSCVDDYQCVAEALDQHSTVYNQTLEAGKHLCKTTTDSECQSQMLLQLQDIEKAWKRTTSLLGRRRDLVNTTVQKWSQCQDGITNIMSDLDELKTRTTQQLPELREKEKLIQETELSLQHLASKLRELGTMKTDLSQYIAAGDSALLEQQLEQLHGQWEELCMKVSLRRQEIADHLNAWTIFNDKNKEFCDWLTQMENKVCHSGDLSIEEMVEKLKKDCMEEINLFSENKSHLKQLGEQLLLASDEAKQTQVHGSLQEVNQRWHNLFHHIEARVKKLKETLVTVQQLDKNMSNLRSWLSRIEAELSRPITYSVCHHQEIQRRLAEQQELQRDIEQHTEGVASVLNLCDVLLRDEDAAGGTEAESDSLHETSSSLDQRWRTICAMALDRRLRIEETWRLWCKFLDDYSRFEDWLKMAERTAANPNSADVLYTVAKEELKKFEGFQRQVHERLTQLELVNNQYRRLARENRTDRASQLKAMVHEGNRRWDALHRRVAAILRRLKYFTSQREEFEGTRESMLVWLTELDLQLTNVEHFSESDVHHKIQQLNSFQKEITLNTERIDGLIVFGESLIQKSSPQDAALIEDELEELHTYCQEVFSRLVRFHQRLSQPPMITKEPELSSTTFSLESSLELIGRLRLGRSQGSLPATPIHLLTSPLERSGRETPVSVDSLPLEWDHTGDVGGSSSHEDDDDDDEKEHEEDGSYFSALSVPSGSMVLHDSSGWASPADTEMHTERDTHTSTPLKHGYLHLMSQCSGSIEDIKRVSLILDDEEQQQELGLTGLTASDKQSGVIERWELLQAQSMSDLRSDPLEPGQLTSDLDNITSWLENVIPELDRLQLSNPATSIEDMEARAKELKEMQKMFTHYKSIMLSVNLRAQEAAELQDRLTSMNRDWSRASTGLQQWDNSLRKTLMRCQEFHETLHSLLLWLAHAESRRYAVDISRSDTSVRALQQHRNTLTELQDELQGRQTQQASLQALWSQLQPEDGAEDSDEAREKLYVTGSKLRLLLKEVDQDLSCLQQRLDCESATELQEQNATAEPTHSKKTSSAQGERRDLSPPRSFFYRVLRAAFPLHLLLLLLLLIPCLIPLSESDTSCTVTNNFARSFYPMLHYTNGPPPT